MKAFLGWKGARSLARDAARWSETSSFTLKPALLSAGAISCTVWARRNSVHAGDANNVCRW